MTIKSKTDNTKEILDAIYNTAEKIAKQKPNDKGYFIRTNGKGNTIIKFRQRKKGTFECQIPEEEYKKLADGLDKIGKEKYEPENMMNWFRLHGVSEKIKLTKSSDDGVVGECYRCGLLVKEGNGVIMLQHNILYHKEPCFRLDRKYFGHVYIK